MTSKWRSLVIPKALALCGIVATICLPAAIAEDAPHFHFTQEPGAYSVGLKVVEQYDTSRTWGPAADVLGKPVVGEHERPLQTFIWYPAEKSSAAPMTVGDYLSLLEMETSFGKPHLWEGWKDWKTGLAGSMSDKLWSVRDAKPVAGHFPIVIMRRASATWRGRTWTFASIWPRTDTSWWQAARW